MKIQGQYQWTDYLEANLLHIQPARWTRIIWYSVFAITGCILIISLYLAITSRRFLVETFPYITIVLVLVISFPLYRYIFLPRRAKQIFEQQKELAVPFQMEVSDTGLAFKNQYSNSNRPWSNFRKWKVNKKILLLYFSDISFVMIPIRFCTDEQIQAMLAYLDNNNVPEASVGSLRSRLIRFAIYFALFIIVIIVVFINKINNP
ncbi:MAG TPA: YcxB family protein [Anaerolineales bacterium]|jgi:choline-glycine betaine transporter|nr:YcxB family protein [Anaerolineales bacterium]